jgi:hypothetical protein
MRYAIAAKDADGELMYRSNAERLGNLIQNPVEDEPVVVSNTDVPPEVQAEQPKKSWKQWLTGK